MINNSTSEPTKSLATSLLNQSDESKNLWSAFCDNLDDKPIIGNKTAKRWTEQYAIALPENLQPHEIKAAAAKAAMNY